MRLSCLLHFIDLCINTDIIENDPKENLEFNVLNKLSLSCLRLKSLVTKYTK